MREVNPHGVKARICCLQGLRQGMRVVSIKKDRCVRFLSQAFHQSGKLARTKELPLSFGGADENRKFGLSCGRDYRLQQDVVRNVEMAQGRAFCFQPPQSIA